MSTFDRGPLRTYEVLWQSGHVETIQAHQVLFKSWELAGGAIFGEPVAENQAPRVTFHAEIDGRWTLLLSALEEDIRTVRDVTAGEVLREGES